MARQIELSKPYAESKPSRVVEIDWVYALREFGEYPAPTPRSGKWLVFRDVEHVDVMWAKVKSATKAGRLGARSKVSTAKPSPLAIDPADKVICVYTYDSDDVEDVVGGWKRFDPLPPVKPECEKACAFVRVDLPVSDIKAAY